jgi:hypothetical protein
MLVSLSLFNNLFGFSMLFVLNRGWNGDSTNDIIPICFLDMTHSWIKKASWNFNSKKLRECCILVSLSLFNNSFGLPVLTMGTTCPNQEFYVLLVDLHIICDT